jgi:putative transcriptional regulator
MRKSHATTADGSEVSRRVDALVHDDSVTDWARVQAMTNDEVMAAALADPDALPLPPEKLARMRRFPDPVRIRGELNQMTQQRFARLFQIPLGTLRDWEQQAHFPDGAGIALLRIIERDPLAAALALNPNLSEAEIAEELGVSGRETSRKIAHP